MIRLCIPSRGRPDFIHKTIAYKMAKYLDTKVVVPVGEKEEYEKYLDLDIVECPEIGLARTRNWIMDNLFTDDVDHLMMMDDDVKNILWGLWKKSVKLSAEDVMNMIQENIELAEVMDVPVWSIKTFPGGINRVKRTGPIHIRGKMINCLVVFKDRSIRFDPELKILDDFELSMRCMHRYGQILADGRYLVEQLGGNMGTVRGGITASRTRKNLDNDKSTIIGRYGPMVKNYMAREGVYAE